MHCAIFQHPMLSGGDHHRQANETLDKSIWDRHRQFNETLDKAVFDARQAVVLRSDLQLPWETGDLKCVFTDMVLPSSPYLSTPVSDPVDTSTRNRTSPIPVFQQAVKFGINRTKNLPESDQMTLLHERWWLALSSNHDASRVGRMVEAIKAVGQVLGGKSVATLAKRYSQLQRYIKWSVNSGVTEFLPITLGSIREFVQHLLDTDASRGQKNRGDGWRMPGSSEDGLRGQHPHPLALAGRW